MRTTAPSMILYIPKGEKSLRFTKSIRNLIANKEMRKEVTIPTTRHQASRDVIAIPDAMNFTIFKRDAPSIMGIAIKNENSAAAARLTPNSIPPMIVEPERDVPGIKEST